MKLLLDFPMIGEPHYAQAILASKIKDKQIRTFDLAGNKDPFAVTGGEGHAGRAQGQRRSIST